MTSTIILIFKIIVILNSLKDWDKWLFLIKSRARENNILLYINIDLTHEPSILLELLDLKLKDVNNIITSIINLNQDKKEIYRLL